MQKVEGSSPFSRSSRSPANRGVFCCPEHLDSTMRGVVQQLCTTNGGPGASAGRGEVPLAADTERCGVWRPQSWAIRSRRSRRAGHRFRRTHRSALARIEQAPAPAGGKQASEPIRRCHRPSLATRDSRLATSRSIVPTLAAPSLHRWHRHRSDELSLQDDEERSSPARSAASATLERRQEDATRARRTRQLCRRACFARGRVRRW
jgi:hypothetical protein